MSVRRTADPPTPTAADDGAGVAAVPLAAALARVTGLLLVPLLALHITTVLLRDPETVGMLFLSQRWDNPLWLLADWALLAVGSLHAVVALWLRVPPDAPEVPTVPCPHCGEHVEVPTRPAVGWRLLAFAVGAAFVVGLFLSASWAMLILV